MAESILTQPASPNWTGRHIDRVSESIGKAWGLCHLLRGQFSGEVGEAERCSFAWTEAVFERVAELVRLADADTDEAPAEVGQAVHAARAQCEVLMSDRSAGDPGEQRLSDEIMDWALWALIDALVRAKDAVDRSMSTREN